MSIEQFIITTLKENKVPESKRQDILFTWHERSAIKEFHGNMPEREAELSALGEISHLLTGERNE